MNEKDPSSESEILVENSETEQEIHGEVNNQLLSQMHKLQKQLELDPKSLAFVQLADLYLAMQMIDAARDLVSKSLKLHPHSVSGLILMGRICKHERQYENAIEFFSLALKKAPTNWYGLLLRAETHLKNNAPKKALQDFKSVLLHNPTHSFSRKAVAKLEILSADDFGDDVFEMRPLKALSQNGAATSLEENIEKPSELSDEFWRPVPAKLERLLALIDAFTVRHEYSKAINLLRDCQAEFGDHGEIRTRRLRLSPFEKAEEIHPKQASEKSKIRSHAVNDKKLAALDLLLRRIDRIRPLAKH